MPKPLLSHAEHRINPLSCITGKWMSYTKYTLSLVWAGSWSFKRKNTCYYWCHFLVTCDITEPLIPVTPSSQIQGSAISSTSKPEGAQVVDFFLLSGLQYPCELCLMESSDGNGLWQKDGSDKILIITFFFSSPNGMTHGDSHFLLPASTWLHYRQTAGDWICFWGWVTTLFLSHSARGKGVRGGHLNAEEGQEISLLYRDDGK